MTKHHWRQQIKSLFERHADPDKHEEMKRSRKDMEEKKEKMMRIIKSEEQDGSKTETLEELMEDYHKQYESVYEEYHRLTGGLNNKADKEKASSSSSDSDSDSPIEVRMREVEKENGDLRSKVVDLELNLRSAERKADELSRGNLEVIELQTTIEDLKRDVEIDKDEMMTIEEKNRNLEVMLRLSNQKRRVTEQLLTEIEHTNAALNHTVEEYKGMIRCISEQLSWSVGEVERSIANKLNEDYGGLGKRVIRLSKEIRNLKGLVREEATSKGKEEVATSVLDDEIHKLVKDKDERITSLEEEKREAIRQLCVSTEYYRSRCAQLRGVILKMH